MPKRVERYGIGLINELLNEPECQPQYTFDFLRGCPTAKRPKGQKLPVDAFYPEHQVVAEIRERQHYGKGPSFWDNRPTACGVPRKVQRQWYDQKRDWLLPAHGIKVLVIYDYELIKGVRREHLKLAAQRLSDKGVNVKCPTRTE